MLFSISFYRENCICVESISLRELVFAWHGIPICIELKICVLLCSFLVANKQENVDVSGFVKRANDLTYENNIDVLEAFRKAFL